MQRPRPPKEFGRTVRRLREEQGLSQENLGYKARLHRNYLGGVERGEINPTLVNLMKLAKGLGLRTSELLALSEETPKRRKN
jgi:transcriptional regulator with XRE-family HTH domain